MSVYFSVVIPLYNKRAFIKEAIRSVLSQYDPSFEIVVVDDGSIDGSAELVEELNDSHIRLIRQKNSGVSAARNTGIAAASGNFICFLDADDWYFTGYLATLRQLIFKYPNAIAYGTSFREVDSTDKADPTPIDSTSSSQFKVLDDFYSSWISGNKFCTCSICVRKEALLGLAELFPVGESLGEDQDVWFRLAERGLIAFAPTALVAYRRNVGDSLTSGRPELVFLPVFKRLAARISEPTFPKHLKSSAKRLLARQCATIARNHLFFGHRLAALRWLFSQHRSVLSRYWWTTMALVLLFPKELALSHEKKRRESVISGVLK